MVVSEMGYGAVAYIRVSNYLYCACVAMLMAKSVLSQINATHYPIKG